MNAATKLPLELGPIHFTGIGGIGMSGIAEVLLNHGYTVQGSDLKASKITERLQGLGARVFIGQKAENLEAAEVVVISSAIKDGNPELEEARRKGLPVVRRAEMLAELMRLKSNIAVAGTHGKTTTTTMVATLLDAGGLDPTVVNGGIIHAYGSNARMGQGEWMVVEADESDGSFNRLPATIAIVTNIDPEHMEHWGDFDALRKGFQDFVAKIPFYGLAVMCTDHPEVQALVGRVRDRRVATFGFNAQADIRAENLSYKGGVAHFDIALRAEGTRIDGCTLPMPGDHNVSNALAAVAVARHLGMKRDEIRAALAAFRRGQPALHPRGRGAWGHRDRRLRPPSGRDRRRATRRAPGGGRAWRPGDRCPSAAPLLAPRVALRGVLRLFQRCRRGRDRRGLRRRRGPDPRRQPRRPGGRADPPRPPARGGA